MATVTGTGGSEQLEGTSGVDTIFGGGGNDTIYGFGGDDDLYGESGDDALIGGSGFDYLYGGAGNDTYVVGYLGVPDGIFETSVDPDEIDRILSYSTWDMLIDDNNPVLGADALLVENIRLVSRHLWSDTNPLLGGTLFAGKFIVEKINATGNNLDNIIEGDEEANTLTGGAGDDTYVIRDLLGATNPFGASVVDTIIETDATAVGDGGNDTIMFTPIKTSTLPFFLPDESVATNQVENLTLGGKLAYNGVGNDLDNILTGNSAANIFDGGLGDDIYVLTSTDKIMVWNGAIFVAGIDAGGVDTVEANFTYTIAARTDLENITLTGTTNINAIGNVNSNFLIGNAANNTLDSGVAGAADTFFGYNGNDVYIINNSSSVVFDQFTLRGDTLASLDSGTDLIKSSVSYDCSTYAIEVENLTLTGTSAINGTGNTFNNVITGNAAVNVLDSGGGDDTLNGGLGADTMIGSGNDVFIVDNDLDKINETSIGGSGTAKATLLTGHTYDMSVQATNVETLLLMGSVSFNGYGNNLSNTITGNTGVNVLHGFDGVDVITSGGGNDNIFGDNGDDTLIGGVSNDTLHGGDGVDSLSGGGGVDTLYGDDGDDSMVGGGHTDTLIGGNGNDIYNMLDIQDIIQENGTVNSTADVVVAYVSFSIAGANTLENLTLVSGTIGIGNDVNNVIGGNGGTNTLSAGAGSDTIFGGGGHDTMDGGSGVDTMTGAAGNDTFIVDNSNDVAIAADPPGPYGSDTVRSSADYDMSVNATKVISLVLTGSAITGTGNAESNTITGNGSVNTLIGLDGNDAFVMDNTSDTIVEAVAGGQDIVYASVSFDLSVGPYDTQEIENITLTGINSINATGNDLNNILTGNTAFNVLDGGLGNDTYDIGFLDINRQDFVPDTIVVDTGGNDTVKVEGTYSIASRLDLDNITLWGGGNYNATGNTNVNILSGNSGVNILDAGLSGGAGDTYIGSAGNDTYMADEANDVVTNLDLGVDLVMASVTYDMSAKAIVVDNLTLTGSANIDGTGNALANLIIGNTGNNVLTGLGADDTFRGGGGVGVDTFVGGIGNDTYFVDNSATIITELALEGTADIVNSSVDYDMSLNAAEVEKLTLTGLVAADGTGNAVDNIITGQANVLNTLSGMDGKDTIDGGTGADSMYGGTGDDTFIVDSLLDYVEEVIGEGTVDLIKTGLTYTLNAAGRQQVENLTLTGALAVNGTGNLLDNTLTGNGAVNTLDGGVGADTMNGGGGNDTYFVDNANDVVLGSGRVFANTSYDMSGNATGIVFLTLTGTGIGDRVGTGNALSNTITGTGTEDYTFNGGSGNDVFILHRIGDKVTDAADGTLFVDTAMVDTVLGSSYDMSTLATQIDALTVTGSGGFDVYDNSYDNTITGNSGLNHFFGSAGYDTFFVGSNDFVDDGGPEGADIVLLKGDLVAVGFSANLTTDAALVTPHWQGIDGIKLTGATALNATGDANSNLLIGNTAANILNGLGGDDAMVGGAGNDTYWVDSSTDIINEVTLGGAGIDLVYAVGVDYTLSLNVDNLTLKGLPGFNDLNGYGNLSGNIIIGTSGNNVLVGGLGADTLNGGTGNDTYGVEAGDTIIDSGGHDLVVVSLTASYTLLSGLEDLTLADLISKIGIGNTVVNIINGSDADNTLDGMAGADTMAGHIGNDTYYVDNKLDVVTETDNPNTVTGADTADLIISKISGALSSTTAASVGLSLLPSWDANSKVENLTLATGGIIGVGNDLDNLITGNAGTNTLYGGNGNDVLDGGLGKDIYYGGAGSDQFYIGVDAATNHDTITDLGGSDILVYNSLLIGFDPLEDVLDDFIAYRWNGTNTLAYVDRDGVTGTAYGFQIVAVIFGDPLLLA
jgi:trimeric autotransporter adhesin